MGSYVKGDLVWYRQRDGKLVEAKVVSVDKGVQPFSYGVQLGDHIRETEASRLTRRTASQTAETAYIVSAPRSPSPSSAQQHSSLPAETPDDGDDFGDFLSHTELPASFQHGSSQDQAWQPLHAAPGGQHQNAYAPWPGQANGNFLPHPQQPFHQQQDSEDDFGDFEDAAESFQPPGGHTTSRDGEYGGFSAAAAPLRHTPQAAEPAQGFDRSAPLAMSLFGEEDDAAADHHTPDMALGQLWGGLPDLPQPATHPPAAAQQPPVHYPTSSHPAAPAYPDSLQHLPWPVLQQLSTDEPHRWQQQPSVEQQGSAVEPWQSDALQRPHAARQPAQLQPAEQPTAAGLVPSRQQPQNVPAAAAEAPMPSAPSLAASAQLPAMPAISPFLQHSAPAVPTSSILAEQQRQQRQQRQQQQQQQTEIQPTHVSHDLPGSSMQAVSLPQLDLLETGVDRTGAEDDDFGDFEAATHDKALANGGDHQQDATLYSEPDVQAGNPADQSAPLDLSLFGDEEAEEPEAEAHTLALFSTWPAAGQMSSVPQEAQLFHTAPAALALQPPLLPSHAADEDTFVGSQQAHWPPAANGVSPPAIVQQDWDHTQPMPTGDCAPDSAVSRRSRQMLLATRIEAWGRLLQICAEELELGRAIWEAHAAGDTLESFCSAAEGQQYLMGLGHVRFASCVLSSAVRQPAVAAAVQPQHHAHLVRCTSAWDAPTQGAFGMTLHQAACEACDSCGAPSLGLMLATASFDAADLERLTEPHWSPGRCGISLLPLKRLPSAPRRSLDSHEQECLARAAAALDMVQADYRYAVKYVNRSVSGMQRVDKVTAVVDRGLKHGDVCGVSILRQRFSCNHMLVLVTGTSGEIAGRDALTTHPVWLQEALAQLWTHRVSSDVPLWLSS